MKPTSILSMLLLTLSAVTVACNDSSAAIENRITGNAFYGLILRSNAQVILTQGDETSVRVEGDNKSVADIKTSIQNGALVIEGKNSVLVTVYVTMGEISLVEVDGTGKIFSNQMISSDMLLLKVIGSGTINLDVRSLTLGMIVRGNGKIYAKGSTGDSYVKVIGSGEVMALNLDSIKVTTEASAETITFSKPKEKRGILRLHQ